MSWHKRFQLLDDVGTSRGRKDASPATAPLPLRRADERAVRDALQGLARRHGLTVGEVARNLETGLWSRDHCLGSMRLQWTFEKMCDGAGFPQDAASQDPPRPRSADPRAA